MIARKSAVSGLALSIALTGLPSQTWALNLGAMKAGLPVLLQSELPQISEAATELVAPSTPERRDINPYNRDIALTVPLQFNRRVLGELPVLLTRDDRFIVDSDGFKNLLNPLLTDQARLELAASLDGIESFEPDSINGTGIALDYDPEQLAVMVLRIDPSKRLPESLFRGGEPDPADLGPEPFAAYLNANMNVQRLNSTGEVGKPNVYLNGAISYRRLVFEADFQGREDRFRDTYEVERRYARFVYDEPETYRRWYLGDLNPETRGRQGYLEMGGFGVARQKRRFEAFRNNVLTGARQIILQEDSVIRVMRNGVFVREFKLDAGQYDVNNLPLNLGNNDIQLEIEGQTGFRDSLNYSAYLDMIDLEPGDYEYGAYVGFLGNSGFGSPDYSDEEAVFTGYYRKAFQDRPAIGLGLQVSEDVQVLTGQTQFVLNAGSRLRLESGVSNSKIAGTGYAFGVTYDFIVDKGLSSDALSLMVDYTSEDFSYLGQALPENQISWAVSSSYSKRFSPEWTVNLNGAYRVSRSDTIDDSYSIGLLSSYRFTPQWSVQAGVDYTDMGRRDVGRNFKGDGFGVSLALVWQPRYDRRAEANYDSVYDASSLRFQQSPRNQVNSYGYSLTATETPDSSTLSGQLDYVHARFDASLSHFALGRSFSDIGDEQATSLRIGTSIATTGGKVAIGRNIFDSFAIVYPHESLKGGVIVGESLEGGRYTSRSGALGPAIDGTLTSYINQSVRYDAISAPAGYDIGAGIMRVRPTYRSGYVIEVGSSRFVSALGRLVGNGNKPLALMSGRISPVDETTEKPDLFFTNSVGRFAMQGLEPGKRYKVEVYSSPNVTFEFTVPADNEGLLDLEVLTLPVDVPE